LLVRLSGLVGVDQINPCVENYDKIRLSRQDGEYHRKDQGVSGGEVMTGFDTKADYSRIEDEMRRTQSKHSESIA
jgi:hypothetical protein